jgi:hypothetical protein
MIKMETKDRIVQLLEDIVEKAHHINNHPEKELCLELDLVMEDLRSLYRQYADLRKSCLERHEPGRPPMKNHVAEDNPPPVEETPEAPPPVEESPVAPPEETPEVPPPAEQPPVTPPEETPAPEKPAKPSPPADSPPTRPPITQSQPLPADNPRNAPGNASRAIGEQFPAGNNSLHERISNMKEDRSIGARMQQHPISNIKDAIGVNEKFLFINELFNGNIQAYHEAIANLNSQGSMQEAFDRLNELNGTYQWDAERTAGTIDKLANFVQRRYMNK